MKITFRITHRTDGQETRDKLVVATGGNEVMWHIALKILGFLLFIEHRPRIEEGIGWHYKPDLVSLDETGQLRLWVDCGNIAVRKIDRVATKVGTDAELYILKRTVREVELLMGNMRRRVKHLGRVRLIAFDDGFVDRLAECIDVTNDLSCERRPDRIVLEIENRHGVTKLESGLHGPV